MLCSLFCLREGLKERELCVFFRNNHFSTMFKVSKSWNVLVSHGLIIDFAAYELLTAVINGENLKQTSIVFISFKFHSP